MCWGKNIKLQHENQLTSLIRVDARLASQAPEFVGAGLVGVLGFPLAILNEHRIPRNYHQG